MSDPIGGRNFPTALPYDVARRAVGDAARTAIAAGVPTPALVLQLVTAIRGQSLPGQREHDLAAQIAALIDPPERNEP